MKYFSTAGGLALMEKAYSIQHNLQVLHAGLREGWKLEFTFEPEMEGVESVWNSYNPTINDCPVALVCRGARIRRVSVPTRLLTVGELMGAVGGFLGTVSITDPFPTGSDPAGWNVVAVGWGPVGPYLKVGGNPRIDETEYSFKWLAENKWLWARRMKPKDLIEIWHPFTVEINE